MNVSIDFFGLTEMKELTVDEKDAVTECCHVLLKNLSKHENRRAYYEDKITPKNRGLNVPREYRDMNCSTGWGAKVVNALAERSVLDSFTFEGEPPPGFERAIADNDVIGQYAHALPSALVDGVGFWTVLPDGAGGAKVSYSDAETSAGVYDWSIRGLSSAMYISNFKRFTPFGKYMPSEVVLMLPYENVIFSRTWLGLTWKMQRVQHSFGRTMAVQMAYQPTYSKPFGRSRISRAAMCYIDRMMEELQNATIQSDAFSVPMKYVLGASDAQYAALAEDIHKAYKAEMLVMTPNEEGQAPHVGMLQGADMTPHIAWMDKLANLMASETSVPVASFGVPGNGYTSSDALRASTDDLVILARKMNDTNAKTMAEVARLVIAVFANKPVSSLDDNERTVTVHFQDPAMPSDAANADAMVKIVSAVPDFAGTEVFWEKLGYDEDSRRRIMSAQVASRMREAIGAALFGAANGAGDGSSGVA